MDGAVKTAATEERLVGGRDDGVGRFASDVAPNNLNSGDTT